MFAEKVSAYTGMSVQAVLDTEAAVFSGQESVDNGLADELVNNTDALSVMREALDRRKKQPLEEICHHLLHQQCPLSQLTRLQLRMPPQLSRSPPLTRQLLP
jgi:ClpP class serine protease